MAVHSIQALNNVSMATGTFLKPRGNQRRTGATSTANAVAGSRRINALGTYNRRQEVTGRQSTVLASLGGFGALSGGLARITSGRSAFAGGPTLQRLASHIGKPRFNALARLASSALNSRRSSDITMAAAAAVAVAPTAPAPPQQIPGSSSSTPFAAPTAQPARSFDSELGFPTDFQDNYKLIEEIGSGSFGTVYAAEDLESGETVAVKILPKGSPSGSRGKRGSGRAGRDIVLGKLQKELDVLQRLQTEGNAVELMGTYEDRSCVYIVMEECRGGDLETLLEDHGPLAEADVARIMHEVLKTIKACHEHSIYHGDVKTANFMLKDVPRTNPRGLGLDKMRPGSWLRAIDFGCAQYVEDGQPLKRKTGTPMFMAPEVFIGNYGLEADLWAAGMMMYQLLADRFPWWDTMEELHTTTLEAVMEAVIRKDMPMDFGPWKTFSQEGFGLIHRLLDRDAGTRISASEALQHPWFAKHGLGEQRMPQSNILPIGRRMSDSLRLRMSAAELSRAQSRPANGLSGLLDDMLDAHGQQPEAQASLCATFA